MKTEALVVLCTFPNETEARQIGAVLVEKQVAACVNLMPGVTSIYQWEGRIHEDAEILTVIKTTRAAYPRLEAMILDLHSYEVPEVIALSVEAGSEKYLAWLGGQAG
jgi:uncharacterized protein involved in tolerance to divalent cations